MVSLRIISATPVFVLGVFIVYSVDSFALSTTARRRTRSTNHDQQLIKGTSTFLGDFTYSTANLPYQKRHRTIAGSCVEENDCVLEEQRSSSIDLMSPTLADEKLFLITNQNILQGTFARGQVISKILSTSFLITGSTVGASMMQLPNAVSQAGIGASALIFLGSYVINLISSLYLIDFSISQYEAGRPASELPTSFKDIADEAFGPTTGYVVAFVSIMFNWAALIFAILKCGSVAHSLVPELNVNPTQVSLIFSAILAVLHIKLSNNALSQMASVCVLALFTSFAGLVIPGLMRSDFSTLLFSPSIASISTATTSPALLVAAPCIVFSMVFQNIVPIATKLCNFDRFQTTASVVLGSAFPPLMYMAWCAVVLAGGVDISMINSSGLLLPIFMLATVGGSSVGGVMSSAEEFESLLEPFKNSFKNIGFMNPQHLLQVEDDVTVNNDDDIIIMEKEESFFSIPAVLLALIPPALTCIVLGGGTSGDVDVDVDVEGGGIMIALHIAGGYCSPFLCWLFPALLFHQQQQAAAATANNNNNEAQGRNTFDWPQVRNIFEWGGRQVSNAYVVFCSFFMLEQQFMKDLTSLFPTSWF